MTDPIDIEHEYHVRLDAMSPAERVARSAAMLTWTCQQLARQITKEQGQLSDEILKCKVALRLYENEPEVKRLIEQRLADVSH